MKKIIRMLFLGLIPVLAISACDLQPKILSFPDSVGEFISARYPALLADPNSQPEIYNSAASDYEVYASPKLYGAGEDDDYLIYASTNDYVLSPDADTGELVPTESRQADDYLQVPLYGAPIHPQTQELEIIVAAGDTLYSLARANNMSVDKLADINKLSEPYSLSVGQKLKLIKEVSQPIISAPAVTKQIYGAPRKVGLQEITIGPGDTLYSLSRKYSIPVNDLAVMNRLSTPFTLSVGQKLKVPKLDMTPVRSAVAKGGGPVSGPVAGSSAAAPKPKISSDPGKKLPALTARSSAKFTWPVRGSVLSGFGAKPNGLFNDGINIGATQGAKVGAAENGVVAYAGNEVKGMGNLVIIQHTGGWMTVYAHMDTMIVRRGTKVSVGQKIGSVGKTGKVDSSQLHFEIRKGAKAYNPTSYLNK